MGMFRPATRKQLKLRAALDGPSGGGKTFTGIRLGMALLRHELSKNPNAKNKRLAIIGTEGSANDDSAEKYKGHPDPDVPGEFWDFDICHLTTFSPTAYTEALVEAGKLGYQVVLVDSLSHAWEGKDGALELKEKKASEGGNSFTAWKDVTPMHRRMVEAILTSPAHVICTMRVKTDHVLEEVINERGKPVMVPRKVGLAPIQRWGMEYEFDVYGSLDWNHILTVSKTRCPAIDGATSHKPGAAFLRPVIEWLETGVSAEPAKQQSLFISDEQTARVTELLVELGKTLESIKVNFPANYGCTELHQLTPDNAKDLIKRLESSLPKKPKANPPPAPTVAPAPVPASAPEQKQPAPSPVTPPAAAATAEPSGELKQGDLPLADVFCDVCTKKNNGVPLMHSPPACTGEEKSFAGVPPTQQQMLAEFDGTASSAGPAPVTDAETANRAELLGQIRKLMRDLNMTDAQALPILKKDYGAAAWDDLTAENAKKVADRLATKLAEKNAKKSTTATAKTQKV